VTTHAMASSSGEAQAKRLERVYEEVAKLLQEPAVAARLRTPPGRNEWSAMQTLGHMTEMIPYWLNHCRTLIAATGTPPAFGRPPGRRSDWQGFPTVRAPTRTSFCVSYTRQFERPRAKSGSSLPPRAANEGSPPSEAR
jgi:hypothetical protein